MHRIVALALAAASLATAELPKFDQVSNGFKEVVSTADGSRPLYRIWKKDNDLLAELPRGWERQQHIIAATQNRGTIFAGLQGPEVLVYWKRNGDRLMVMTPELDTRSNGEQESKDSVRRIFTDTMLFDIPILAMGPSGQPVVDLDSLLLRSAAGGLGLGGLNASLAEVVTAKTFPQNTVVSFDVPNRSGQIVGLYFSIVDLPRNSGYKPREADNRIGYFMTSYRDLGDYNQKTKWKRYIHRWNLQKRDPSLKMSPPKEPIIYYIEHTVPVRYRRWLRQGVLYWNNAFAEVGIDNAIEVYFQDKQTGAHMDKDPEDVRYSFIRWLNNDVSTAIGPSRANPLTGEIFDADIVLTDGWIRAYWGWYYEDSPDIVAEGMSPDLRAWYDANPHWDPRLLVASPARRAELIAARTSVTADAAEPAIAHNPDLYGTCTSAGCTECMAAQGLASHMAFAGLMGEDLAMFAPEGDDGAQLDGIPEWFVGPLFAELVCHEVGHTLGLRHNFKASSLYTHEQMNSEEFKGKKTIAGSVMDYLPPNFRVDTGEVQGDFTMIDVGPYDKWAIRYGYTFGDPTEVLTEVNVPEHAYLTDDDTVGPDPFARRYDFTADPHDYAMEIMQIVGMKREKILSDFVKDGESWSRSRTGYLKTLSMQSRMISMMANWLGGSDVSRNQKGDPDGRAPVMPVEADPQREALAFVMANAFEDEAFGMTTELLHHMTTDQWSDNSEGDRSDPTFPIHSRISGIQRSALSQIMNPVTLRRIYDNEIATPSDTDQITLAEVMDEVVGNVFRELDGQVNGGSSREPAISNWRRGLQAELVSRLAELSSGKSGMPGPTRTLSTMHLKRLKGRLARAMKGKADPYTEAHLDDLHMAVDRALNRIETVAGATQPAAVLGRFFSAS